MSKYGIKAQSGGGRSSARETISRVAAGCVAEKFLNKKFGTEIVCWVNSIGNVKIPKEISDKFIINPPNRKEIDEIGTYDIFEKFNDIFPKFSHLNYKNIENILFSNRYSKQVYKFSSADDKKEEEVKIDFLDIKFCNINEETNDNSILFQNAKYHFRESITTRCPHPETSLKMIRLIIQIRLNEDSIGGITTCVIKNCPMSIGEPCFDKLEAELAKAMLSIPATKGFEIGSGFEGTKLK